MAYHPLANETGGDEHQRRQEADRILKILRDNEPCTYTFREEEFLDQIEDGGRTSTYDQTDASVDRNRRS